MNHSTRAKSTDRDKAFEAFEARYFRSEERRMDTFQPSLYKFQREFQEEDDAQSAGECGRVKNFDDSMASFKRTFVNNIRRQEERYNGADTEREETFRRSNAVREVIFSQGQQGRADAFKSAEEARAKSAEWNAAARRTILLDGRQKMKDTCISLDALLTDQFHRILDTQEENFLANERRRDELVRTTLGKTEDAHEPARTQSADLLQMAMAPRGRSSSRSRSRSRSRSLSPSTESFHGMPPPPSPPSPLDISSYVLEYTDKTMSVPGSVGSVRPTRSSSCDSSRSRSQTVPAPSSWSRPQTMVASPLSNSKGSGSGGSARNIEDVFIKGFLAVQEQRQEVFIQEEEGREHRFWAAEVERGEAEWKRSKAFDLKVDGWSKRFEKMLESYDERFRGQEEARSEENRPRNAAFKFAQEQFFQAFLTSLSHTEKQAEVEEECEKLLAERLKGMTSALYRKQANQLSAARDGRRNRFTMAQQRRDTELGVHRPAFCITTRSAESEWSLPAALEWPWSKPPLRDEIQPPPPDIFTPSSLFYGGMYLQEPLLLPPREFDDIDSELIEPPQELTIANLQRWHHAVFERSEARRAELFERETQRRRHTFKTNEAKRVAEFDKAQRARAETVDEAEDYRDAAFQEAQQRRERSFQAAERTREADFQRGEAERDAQFKSAQEERAQRFQATQLELQNQCFYNDKRRLRELEEWGEKLVETRLEREKVWDSQDEQEFEAFSRISLEGFHRESTPSRNDIHPPAPDQPDFYGRFRQGWQLLYSFYSTS
ncbi:hypothetical protein DXG01_016137 [Tephrocybe rancida]|nr:hypothetical protein DXG01_016137 [Tephrocybe rancida]